MRSQPFTGWGGGDIDKAMTTKPTGTKELPLPLTPVAAALKPPASGLTPDTRPTPVEIGGPKGPEPTRYGDWERKGRCSDF
jgi:hypothetical protein